MTDLPGGSHSATFRSGDVVLGRYRIVRRLGRGGMGEVYEALDEELKERIAIKTVRMSADPAFATPNGLVQELQLARRVPHPNVCRLYHVDRDKRPDGDVLFITMELLEGGTLAERLKDAQPLETPEALQIAKQIGAGLDAAHAKGIVHRDLKPTNIMFAADGRVVVTDFGLARLQRDPDATTMPVSRAVGTVGYMAPELLLGAHASAASDVYAFGVVLHQMVTGRHPVRDSQSGGISTPSSLIPGLAEAWDELILGCLAPIPDRRFRSAADALAVLDSPELRGPSRRRSVWRYVGLCALVLMSVALESQSWRSTGKVVSPLPRQRYVALMARPSESTESQLSVVLNVLNAISTRLSRAEASGGKLMVISSSDVSGLGALREPSDAVRLLGANLVLTASMRAVESDAVLTLDLVDPTTGRSLRRREVHAALSSVSQIPEEASTAAAVMLGVLVPEDKWTDQDELSRVSSTAYRLFTEAESLAAQPNDAGLAAAIERFQQAIEADNAFAYAYARLSLAYSRMFDRFRDPAALALALRNAELASRFNAQSLNSLLARATVDLYSGNAESALTAIQHGLELDAGNPQLLLAQARAFQYLNRIEDEQRTYRELIRNRPNFWPAYNELGLLLFRQGEYSEAAKAFSEGALVAPRVVRLLNNLGAMQLSMMKSSDAEQTFRRSADITPSEIAYTNLGTIAFVDGRFSEALEFYQQARALNPRNDVIWRNIGDCYTKLGDRKREQESYAKAAELAGELLSVNGTRGSLWMQFAFYNAKLGRRDAAEQALVSAAANNATDLQSQFRRAQVLAVLGRQAEALAAVLECLDRGLSPADVDLALDLDEIRRNPSYISRVKRMVERATGNSH
jgi:serine/threonine protein kinase/tetratricopeptide (TPR) repeat protein